MQLIRADYLIADPSQLAAGVIRDGALVIEDGRVREVGVWAELEPRYNHLTPLRSAKGRLVVPGFVNAHHHGRGVDTRLRAMQDKPLELWLPSFILYPSADPYWDTLLSAAKMLRSGVTTSLQAHSHPGPFDAYERSVRKALNAYRDAGVRIAFAPGLYDQKVLAYENDAVFKGRLPRSLVAELDRYLHSADAYIDAAAYITLFEDLVNEHQDSETTHLLLNPIGLHWASNSLLQLIRETMERLGVGVHIHLVETQLQKAYARLTFGKTAPAVLKDFGLLGKTTSLAHAVWSTDSDVELYAQTGTTIVTNPSSNLRLGSGLAPLSRMLDQGVNVALGMDSMGLFGDDDLLTEMVVLQALHRPVGHTSRWLSPYEALRLATVGGAKAALFAGQVGKLLPSYHADITVIDLKRFNTSAMSPELDVVAVALSQARADDVDMVLVGGDVLVQGGQLTQLDVAGIRASLERTVYTAGSSEKLAFLRRLEPYLKAFYETLGHDDAHPFHAQNSRY